MVGSPPDAVRTILRSLLARLASLPPHSLRFGKTAGGKPYLVGSDAVSFNLSHSRDCSLIALSRGGEIGCDIENRFRADDDVDQLSPLILHPAEQEEMDRLAAPERRAAFKRYWVRKEAALKAAGSGFLKDPRAVIVGQDRAQTRWPGQDGPVLHLHNQQLADDCVAAVASMDPACSWCLLQA